MRRRTVAARQFVRAAAPPGGLPWCGNDPQPVPIHAALRNRAAAERDVLAVVGTSPVVSAITADVLLFVVDEA